MRHALVYLLFGVAASAAAAEPLLIPRRTAPIVIDGDLSDAGWQNAAVITTWYEYMKTDNGAPPVTTTAWVTYDDKYFYVGVRCDDPDPKKVRAPYVDRDHVFGDQDNVGVTIDARGEGKDAIELRVNPRGIQGDALFDDATFTEDFSPDFFYDTATRITDTGWNAEYRIPLSTLRYKKADVQTWGLNIIRNYPRDFRYAISSNPFPRGSNCFICHAMKITGMRDLPSSQHLIAAPYVTAQNTAAPSGALGTPLRNSTTRTEAGADVKWSPSSDIALDATINPDFSQVEADVAQIAANQRFALFFPEKRPFFLEGADLLLTPIQAVYTRTITAPKWGLRATGKQGATTWTTLIADDRGGGSVVLPGPLGSDFAPQDFKSLAGIARVRRDIGRSSIGMLATVRENGSRNGHNRVLGPDFLWRFNDADYINGQVLFSETDDPRTGVNGASGHALKLNWNHSTEARDGYVTLQDFSNLFRADDGFVPQVGFRQGLAGGGVNWYPKNSRFLQYRVYANGEYTTDIHRNLLVQDPSVGFFTRAAHDIASQVEVHAAKYETGRGVIGRNYVFWFLTARPSGRWPQVTVQLDAGEQIDFANSRPGHGFNLSVGSTHRPVDKLQAELTYVRQQLDVAGGRLFDADVERLRVTYSFTSKSLLRAIAQYVETRREPARYLFPVPARSGSFLGSLLYSYKVNWQTLLFVGYGDDRILAERGDLLRSGRTLFVKVSYAFQR